LILFVEYASKKVCFFKKSTGIFVSLHYLRANQKMRKKQMSDAPGQKTIFDAGHVNSFVEKIANSIYEEFFSKKNASQAPDIAFLGIQQGGVPLARRIAKILERKTKQELSVGMLDISMYRDDFGRRRFLPHIYETYIPFDLDDKVLILADDVLQTGRSIRAALDAVTDYGRPSKIRLAVLLDRELHEFPICADYIGEKVSVPREFRVKISWTEYTGSDAVYTMLRTQPDEVS